MTTAHFLPCETNMKLLSLLLTAILCATASAQTIKTLGYNSTNGQVVANTGTNTLRFTNSVSFDGGPFINASGVFWGSASGGGLNLEEEVFTDQGQSNLFSWGGGSGIMWYQPFEFYHNDDITSTRANLGFSTNLNTLWTATNAAAARTNLSLGLPALTNTSNVTMMRALSGSTNTNEPYSGSISVVGTNNTNTLVFSNGILQSVQ